MVAALLIAGVGSLLAGLLAIGFGIPVKEFSFGNTLILAGVVGTCAGLVLLGLWMVVRELRHIAQRLGPGAPEEAILLPATAVVTPGHSAQENADFPFSRGEPAPARPVGSEPVGPSAASSPPPWQEGQVEVPVPVEAAVKPKRNLLFSSSSRKERERAQARTTDPSAISAIDVRAPAPSAPPVPEPDEASPPATFDDAWPQSERSRTAPPLPPRGGRTPSTFTEASAAAPRPDRRPSAPRDEDQPPVTVLKSGVVDGMAYSLYSDGSIEAQMPEGMMRFASIDELRSHLDQRP